MKHREKANASVPIRCDGFDDTFDLPMRATTVHHHPNHLRGVPYSWAVRGVSHFLVDNRTGSLDVGAYCCGCM